MRGYPANSPKAAARIVALTVVADGDIGDAEIAWLHRMVVHEQLGLTRHELHALLDTFCEDLLSNGQLQWTDACPVDERTLAVGRSNVRTPGFSCACETPPGAAMARCPRCAPTPTCARRLRA